MKILGIIFLLLFSRIEAVNERNRKIRDVFDDNIGNKILDLTHTFDETTLAYPGFKPFQLNVTNRGYTKDGYWLQTEDYSAATHIGTHMDAPCHIMEGQWTLEQIPLRRFMAPAAVVDITSRSNYDRNANLEVEDLIEWENKARRRLDGTVVLVNSGWGKKWNSARDFLGNDFGDISTLSFPGISPEAAEWLARNRKVYGVGIDSASLDNGQAVQRKAHQALFRANIYGLENVANLHMLPAVGAFVYVFPMRIKGACGAPVRIIAFT